MESGGLTTGSTFSTLSTSSILSLPVFLMRVLLAKSFLDPARLPEGRPHRLPFPPDRFPDRVGASEVSSDGVIRSHFRRIQDRFHLSHGGEILRAEHGFVKVHTEHGFVRLDVFDFPDELGVQPDLHGPNQLALQDKGKLPDVGGVEQQTPPQATVIMLGFPSLSYVPTTHTGVGNTRVFAPIDFFMAWHPPFFFPSRHPSVPMCRDAVIVGKLSPCEHVRDEGPRPPLGLPFPGAFVRISRIFSPASSDATTWLADSLERTAFCSAVAAPSIRSYAGAPEQPTT